MEEGFPEILRKTSLKRFNHLMVYPHREPQEDRRVWVGEHDEVVQAIRYLGWQVANRSWERTTLGICARIGIKGAVSATWVSPMIRSSRSVQPTLKVEAGMFKSVAQAIELSETLHGLVLRLETASLEEISVALDSVGR